MRLDKRFKRIFETTRIYPSLKSIDSNQLDDEDYGEEEEEKMPVTEPVANPAVNITEGVDDSEQPNGGYCESFT